MANGNGNGSPLSRMLPASFIGPLQDPAAVWAADPANAWPGAPPNFGQEVVTHVSTFSGMYGGQAAAYQWHDEAIRDSRENAWRMRTDCGIMECVEGRQRVTALLNWHLQPEDEKDPEAKAIAGELTKILRRTPRFTELRRVALEALWYGRYGLALQYKTEKLGQHNRFVMKRWEPREGDKLVFRFDDGSHQHDPDQVGILVGAGYRPSRYKPGKVGPTQYGMAYWLDPWERKLCAVHKHMIEDAPFTDPSRAGAIHGVGIRDKIYWSWYGMVQCLGNVLNFIERAGFGVEIWRYPAGNDRAKKQAEEAAKKVTSNGRTVLIVPVMPGEDAELWGVEHLEPGFGGVDAAMTIVRDYFGHKIKRYILGQTLTTEADATGLGSGVADAHMATFADIVKYDATNLEETITTDIVRPLQSWNFPRHMQHYIRFVIDTESPDVDRKLEAYNKAYQMGAKLRSEDVLNMIGAGKPNPGDEVLWIQDQQQRPGGPGDDGGPPGQPQPQSGLNLGGGVAGFDKKQMQGRGVIHIGDKPQVDRYTEDAQGHEHRGKGEGGGQFVSKVGGSGETQGKKSKQWKPTKEYSDWNYRKNGRWQSEFTVGMTSEKRGNTHVTTNPGIPVSMDIQNVDTNAFELDPNEPEHAMAIGLKKKLGESPKELSFENIRTGYGDEGNKFGVTGTGHAKEIIRNVSDRVLDYLHFYKPKFIYYTAAEDSRKSLYEFMTRRIETHNENYIGVKVELPGDDRGVFAIVRKDAIEDARKSIKKKGVKVTEYKANEKYSLFDSDETPDRYISAADVHAAADQTAEPTEAQAEAGNYPKGRVKMHGLTVVIETPAGRPRKPGWKPIAHPYGYILTPRKYSAGAGQRTLWDEEEHPRNESGEFASKGEGATAAPTKEKTPKKKAAEEREAKKQAAVAEKAEKKRLAEEEKAKKKAAKASKKPKAKRGNFTAATKEGTGKSGIIKLADGTDAPPHVQAYIQRIQPAWTDLQVSTDPDSEVIATAKDAKGRPQTVYVDSYTMKTAALKFARTREMLEKAADIHRVNQANRSDVKKREAAEAVWLMEVQATRPGSDKDTGADKEAFGATNLRAEHIRTHGDTVYMFFGGKKGVQQGHIIHNPELAKMLLTRKASAKERDGRIFGVNERQVNAYIKKELGGFSAKDFRTKRANELAVKAIAEIDAAGPPQNDREYKQRVKEVSERVANVLGNQPAESLKSYIDPTVFVGWTDAANTPYEKPTKKKSEQ